MNATEKAAGLSRIKKLGVRINAMFAVVYHYFVVKEDIPRITSLWRIKIKQAIEDKLTTKPEIYGKPLRRSLKGYRKLRMGDYRIIYQIDKNKVKIFVIQHRSVVYRTAEGRI